MKKTEGIIQPHKLDEVKEALLRQLFDKLGVRTRAQLERIALRQYRDQPSGSGMIT